MVMVCVVIIAAEAASVTGPGDPGDGVPGMFSARTGKSSRVSSPRNAHVQYQSGGSPRHIAPSLTYPPPYVSAHNNFVRSNETSSFAPGARSFTESSWPTTRPVAKRISRAYRLGVARCACHARSMSYAGTRNSPGNRRHSPTSAAYRSHAARTKPASPYRDAPGRTCQRNPPCRMAVSSKSPPARHAKRGGTSVDAETSAVDASDPPGGLCSIWSWFGSPRESLSASARSKGCPGAAAAQAARADASAAASAAASADPDAARPSPATRNGSEGSTIRPNARMQSERYASGSRRCRWCTHCTSKGAARIVRPSTLDSSRRLSSFSSSSSPSSSAARAASSGIQTRSYLALARRNASVGW